MDIQTPEQVKENFIAIVSSNLESQDFVRLTLGKYRGGEAGLTQLVVRVVQLKSECKLSFTYRYKTRELVKNHPIQEALDIICQLIGTEFLSATLFTNSQNIQIEYNKSGQAKLITTKSTLKQTQESQSHDRQKQQSIAAENNPYLIALGITNRNGQLVRTMEDKFKQINKFIEILQGLISNSPLADQSELKIVDMGSGKGYLTFAMYDYLTYQLNRSATVVGVEGRSELVEFCNQTAKEVGFEQLHFEQGYIQDYQMTAADVTIALHACDTATDDAIYKGIQSQSSIIVLSPCCHKQIRRQIKSQQKINSHPALQNILKHGILLERQAETVTDALRALFLELSGYKTKVFEFIAPEHTSKNMMIVGVKQDKAIDRPALLQQIADLKALYGIQLHYLESLLFPAESPNLSANLESLIGYSETQKS